MDAIKPGFWSDSEPINLIRDALNRGEIAHTDGEQVKYFAPGCRSSVCDSLAVAAPSSRPPVPDASRQTGVRTAVC